MDDDYGTGGMEVITDVMKGYNMELVACEAFDAASTDMSAQLVNVKAADPDCLIMWCMYTPGATIATQAAPARHRGAVHGRRRSDQREAL